ncbi:MAG: glycoside hydrolase family 32 protein [Novosphingobium sp.]
MRMSSHRPNLHLAPPAGWLNDPNGLIRHQGKWHAFYQHDPDQIGHGTMHWGHAVSDDLVHWRHQPVALYPDALGACWSGSAIATEEGAVKLFYTAHRKAPDGRDDENQCLVHVDPDFTIFEKDASNPVLTNSGETVFRDPKVLWHAESGRWIMVLTTGQAVSFFSSSDLHDWQFESSFGRGQGHHDEAPWECPDLVEIEMEEGGARWVLIVGIAHGSYSGGSGTQYFVGHFDGHGFTNDNAAETVLWLDFGRDFYAAQTFFNSGRRPVALAWASNWRYALLTPAQDYRHALSLPRSLSLRRTASGLRLAQKAPETVKAAFPVVGDQSDSAKTGTYRLRLEPAETEGEWAIHLFGDDAPQFAVTRRNGSAVLHVHRDERWAKDVAPHFASSFSVPLPEAGFDLEIYVDRGLVELSACDGLVWVTMQYFPERPEGEVRLVRRTVEVLALAG